MRAYVTGGTGFVGSSIVKVFAAYGAEVHCPVHSFLPVGRQQFTWEQLDLLDTDALQASVVAQSPDVIVHAMILNDFAMLYADRSLAWRSYVGTTEALADAANACGAKLIFVSSDWVFDGTQAGATEVTPPNPVNLYGVLKMAGEIVTLQRAERGAVARVSGVNGVHWARPSTPRRQDRGFGYFVASIVDALSAGTPFTVWESDDINMVATPSLATVCADVMHRIARDSGAVGTFHCCGADAVTRRELAELTCDVFDLDSRLLRFGTPDPEVMPGGHIPYDTSLAVTRTTDVLGYQPPTARELLIRFRTELTTGELGGRPASAEWAGAHIFPTRSGAVS